MWRWTMGYLMKQWGRINGIEVSTVLDGPAREQWFDGRIFHWLSLCFLGPTAKQFPYLLEMICVKLDSFVSRFRYESRFESDPLNFVWNFYWSIRLQKGIDGTWISDSKFRVLGSLRIILNISIRNFENDSKCKLRNRISKSISKPSNLQIPF